MNRMLREINKIRRRAGLPPKALQQAKTSEPTGRREEVPDIIGGTLIWDFLQSCAQRNLSKATIRAYASDLRHFAAVSGSVEPPGLEAVIAYKTRLFEEPLAPATRLRRMITLASWCNWLVDEGHLQVSPVRRKDLRIKLPRSLPRHLQMEDVNSVFTQLYARRGRTALRDQALIEILACTGVRVGELVALDTEDFDVSRGVIRVMGKGSRERIVPITDSAALKTIRKHHSRMQPGPFFVSRSGSRLTPQYVRCLIAKVLPGATPHQFRHTFATSLLRDGVDIRFIQRLLGHSSIAITERYASVDDSTLIDVLVAHNPRRLSRGTRR